VQTTINVPTSPRVRLEERALNAVSLVFILAPAYTSFALNLALNVYFFVTMNIFSRDRRRFCLSSSFYDDQIRKNPDHDDTRSLFSLFCILLSRYEQCKFLFFPKIACMVVFFKPKPVLEYTDSPSPLRKKTLHIRSPSSIRCVF